MAKLHQDLPPKGGYPYPIQWQRNLPARGFRPTVYLGIVVGICSYGFYKLTTGIREKNELVREKQWTKFYLQPLLEAEADRDYYRRFLSIRSKEQEIMSEVPDFDVNKSVYHGDKFHKPAVSAFPKF